MMVFRLLAPAGRPPATGLWAAALVLAALAGTRAVQTVADPSVAHVPTGHVSDELYLFTADMLYPAALYQDLLDGYPPAEFRFSAATFAVPDVAAFMAVRPLAGSAAAGTILWEGLFVGLITAAAAAGLRAVAPAGGRRLAAPLAVLATAAWAALNAATRFQDKSVRELFLPLHHGGAVANLFLAVWLAAGYLRGGGRWRLPALALLTAASAFSDRLTGPYLVGPVVLALAATRLLVRPAAGQAVPVPAGAAAGVAVALAAGAAGGLYALHRFDPADPLASLWDGPTLAAAPARAAALGRVVRGVLAAGQPVLWAGLASAAAAAGILAAAAARRVRGRPATGDPSGAVFLAALSLAVWAGTVGLLLLSKVGLDGWPLVSRYLTGPLLVGGFASAGWLATRAARGGWGRAAGVGLPLAGVAALTAAAWAGPRHPALDLLRYRPAYLAELDGVAGAAGLTDGLGEYWAGKPATLLSHRGLRVRAVAPASETPSGMLPRVWLSHPAWLWRSPGGGDPVYQFVLARDDPPPDSEGLRTADIVARHGPPAERRAVGRYTLLVYPRPEDWRLRHYPRADRHAVARRWDQEGRRSAYAPAAALDPAPDRPPAGPDRTAAPGRPPGLLAHGPYLEAEAGRRYRATWELSAAGDRPVGQVDVLLHPKDGRPAERPVVLAVEPGAGDLTAEFDIPADGPRVVELRCAYSGAGTLTLCGVRLDRVP